MPETMKVGTKIHNHFQPLYLSIEYLMNTICGRYVMCKEYIHIYKSNVLTNDLKKMLTNVFY